jgi:Mrp family chromosome partitioning ATPase
LRFDAEHARPAVAVLAPAAPLAEWRWPTICERLLNSSAGPGFRGLASLLRELLVERGERSLAFTGHGRKAGRTTLVLTVARLLAQDMGQRVLVIDLDFGKPDISVRLEIDSDADLWEPVCGLTSAANARVTLIPDRLSVLTLRESKSSTAITAESAAAIRSILHGAREDFDVVLIDAGPWDPAMSSSLFSDRSVEACVCVTRYAEPAGELNVCECCRQAGIDVLGIVETFVPTAAACEPNELS